MNNPKLAHCGLYSRKGHACLAKMTGCKAPQRMAGNTAVAVRMRVATVAEDSLMNRLLLPMAMAALSATVTIASAAPDKLIADISYFDQSQLRCTYSFEDWGLVVKEAANACGIEDYVYEDVGEEVANFEDPEELTPLFEKIQNQEMGVEIDIMSIYEPRLASGTCFVSLKYEAFFKKRRTVNFFTHAFQSRYYTLDRARENVRAAERDFIDYVSGVCEQY